MAGVPLLHYSCQYSRRTTVEVRSRYGGIDQTFLTHCGNLPLFSSMHGKTAYMLGYAVVFQQWTRSCQM
jgi:hypothetical protein